MFGINILGVDLNSNDSDELDIGFNALVVVETKEGKTSTIIPLEPCTEDHWGFSDDTRATFLELGGSTWVCPQMGFNVRLGGREAGNKFSYM